MTSCPFRSRFAISRPVAWMYELSGSRWAPSGVGTQMAMASQSCSPSKSVVAWYRPLFTAAATRSAPMCLMNDSPLRRASTFRGSTSKPSDRKPGLVEEERQRKAHVALPDDADAGGAVLDARQEGVLHPADSRVNPPISTGILYSPSHTGVQRLLGMIDRVLVVCVGNICRSPMAEALLRARLGRRPRFTVSSAGVSALVGHPADPAALELMRERGIDIAGHRARQVTPDLVALHDLVLVMERGHEGAVLAIAPQARGKVHSIGKFGKLRRTRPVPPAPRRLRGGAAARGTRHRRLRAGLLASRPEEGARMTRRNSIALALAAALTSACSLAPGIHLKDAEVTERAREQQGNDEFQIQVVSPYAIQKLAKQHRGRGRRPAGRPERGAAQGLPVQGRPARHPLGHRLGPPELTSPTGQYRSPEENGQVVYADGTMFYPFVGYIHVAGKTVNEIQRGTHEPDAPRHQGPTGLGARRPVRWQACRDRGRGEVSPDPLPRQHPAADLGRAREDRRVQPGLQPGRGDAHPRRQGHGPEPHVLLRGGGPQAELAPPRRGRGPRGAACRSARCSCSAR